MWHCPRCRNAEIVWDKAKGPHRSDGTTSPRVYSFYCPRCALYESAPEGTPGFDPLLDRWSGGSSPPAGGGS